MIEKQPFRSYQLDEDKKADVIALRLNKDERLALEKAKNILNQKKDGTTIKQLMTLGQIVLHDGLTGKVLSSIFKNKANNERLGIVDFE